MTTFYVGQPVRIVLTTVSTYGRECRVVALNVPGVEFSRHYFGIAVDIPHQLTMSGWCVYEPEDLEPILPEGHQPAELSVEELLPFLKSKERV